MSVGSTSDLSEVQMRNREQYDALERELVQALPANPANACDQAPLGCPDSADLRRFEAGKYGHNQEQRDAIMSHLAICDRCLTEMVQLKRRRIRVKRTGLVLAFAAAILIAVSIGLQRHAAIPNRLATIDLRLSSPARGADIIEERGTISIRRNTGRLQLILLPGSEGHYEFQLLGDKQADPILQGGSQATVENDKVILNLNISFTGLTRGKYNLALRRNGSNWEYYRLIVE
jgi:hypothetical protein